MRRLKSSPLSDLDPNRLPSTWEQVELGELLDGAQYGLNTPPDPNGNVAIIGMKDLSRGKVRNENLVKTSVTASEHDAHRLRCGDLLINRTNSLALVGKTGIVEADIDAVFASYLVRLRCKSDCVDPWYLNYFLCGPSAQGTIKRVATPAVAQANVNPTELQKYCVVPLPQIPEQRRIAEVLRTWDEAIEKTECLIEGNKSRRDHFRRQLVSWSRWPKCAIGDVVKPVNRPVPTPTTAYKALSIRSHCKGTFHRLIERPEEIDMETVYEVGPHDLIVNITFAWEGAIALAKPEDAGLFVSHRFPTFEVDEATINRDFLGYVVRTRRFVHYLGIASPGGAGRNRVLNKNDFLEIEIPFPPRSEQDRTAAILSTADREIALLEAQRDALENQKRGLMQKLLTGEWRISVDEPSTKLARKKVAG